MKADPKWINKENKNGQKPLIHAILFDHIEVAQWLLVNGAERDATSLHNAISPRMLKLLLRHGADLTASRSGRTPLVEAANEAVKAAHQATLGGPQNRKNCKFIADRWRKKTQVLIELGAYYDIQSAIILNDIERVRVLLKGDPSLARVLGEAQQVPLRNAARRGRVEICKLLLRYKADPDDWGHPFSEDFTIICEAIEHTEVVKLLLDAGANLEKRKSSPPFSNASTDGTVLHFAAEGGSVESAKLLLDRGVDINAKDSADETPLHVAARRGRPEMVRYLLDRGANPNALNSADETPLHVAARCGRPEMVRYLLDRGADPNALNNSGKTAWELTGHVYERSRQGRAEAFAEIDRILRSVTTLPEPPPITERKLAHPTPVTRRQQVIVICKWVVGVAWVFLAAVMIKRILRPRHPEPKEFHDANDPS